MGGGDLNLKKSFHPALRRNQQAVWDEEQKALAERKRTQQRLDEIKEERAKEEVQRQLEAAGGKKKVDRVEWMYQGPNDGQTGTTEETEAYLLGKRRIDNLIKGTEHKKLEKDAGTESFMALQNANTARDTAAKIREDPLLAIKRQEQAAYEAMMNDPARRRQLLASRALMRRRKTSHGERRTDTGGDTAIVAQTGRTDTTGEDDLTRDRKAHVDVMAQERIGTGDAGMIAGTDIHEEDATVQTKGVDATGITAAAETDIDTMAIDDIATSLVTSAETTAVMSVRETTTANDKAKEEERQRKLAAMQSAATELDVDRQERLADLEKREQAAREADNKARERGGDRGFVNKLHQQAEHKGLAERMGGARRGYQKDDD
ncbi:Pre-mRNA-splicing factor CWC25 [Fusarium culmorum]|uniref:Pre-mRNA-splicing factor CWC25 n=1 Tax=Fusarium culmorum TaxID=5516 RepID=A0A2T4HBD3_FUSCU|nr:Pre-mRNA-splicing factor CWC25 [Fusarium culmorum]